MRKSSSIILMFVICYINIFLCVCFAEEVILADDENENDYDGMNLPLLRFLYMHECDFFKIMLISLAQQYCCTIE